MQYRPRLKEGLNKRRVIIGLIAIVIILFLLFITLPKNCKTNEECFNLKASKCDKVKATLIKNDNQLNYRVLGNSDNDCITRITMVKVAEKQSVELKQTLEGKSMDCAIPMNLLIESNMNEVDNIYDYCTGSLKEAFLDVTLQKMYDLVIKNLGTLTAGLQEVLNQSDKI